MKLRHLFPCLLLAGMTITVTSCSEEASLNYGQGRNVKMTVNIDRGSDATRSILTEEDGDLVCTWEATDHIIVTDAAGNKLGVLALTDGAGDTTATFSGVINTEATGNTKVNFLYLGSKSEEQLNALTNPVTVDFSAQDGSLAWIQANDFFSGSQEVMISASVATAENVTLARQIAFGKFEMSFPSGITYAGEPITISGEGVNTLASVSMTDGAVTFSKPETGGVITITPDADNVSNEFYVTMLPGAEIITPTFSVTINGKTYSSTLTARQWSATEFVRKDNGDGTYSGIALSMQEPGSSNLPKYEGYEDEDPRNPLHRFAKFNLTRGDDNLNVFVDDSKKYGALYQWGRYFGFIDVTSTSGFGKYSLSTKAYSQYADALGQKTINNSDIWDYSMYDVNYDNSASQQYTNPNYPASGLEYLPIVVGMNYRSGYNGTFFDYSMFYYTKNHFETTRPQYMMNGNPEEFISLMRYGSGSTATYLDEFSNSYDYWVDDFNTAGEDGGEYWSERSEAQGFSEDKLNPCPSGWRLPTSEEMSMIIPRDGLFEKNGSLATMLNNYTELRTTKDGLKYAIRWNYNSSNSYIEIEAVVIDDASYISVNQITSEFWEANSGKKVVRQFPFTGGIRPFTGNIYGNYTYDTIICRPIGMGKPTLKAISLGYSYVGLLDPNESISVNKYFGGYWVDEKGLAMKFCAQKYEREVNGNVREAHSEYPRIRMEETGPAFGMAIRPVMDIKTE